MTPRGVNRAIVRTVCLWAAVCLNLYAADVVSIEKTNEPSLLKQQVKEAIDFYGLREKVVKLGETNGLAAITAIKNPGTVAVVIAADVLPSLSRQEVLAALGHRPGANIPVLIAGIDGQTDIDLLKSWSEGSIVGGKKSDVQNQGAFYHIAAVTGVTQELSGGRLPFNSGDWHYLGLNGTRSQLISSISSGSSSLPVFVRINNGLQEIYFSASNMPSTVPVTADPYREPSVFVSLAPEMMFLRHAAGERAWHSPGHYANLTIDDAWLREPYGYVDYENLLREMNQHNFHTTIAFIPWNFDRSQPVVVSLFRTHSDRFSICVHGDNHDHQEFGSYSERPLDGQTYDIKQALARMAKFHELTGLGFDPVMVFPHSISPQETLAVMKRYNFWATANSLNVPMGSEAPEGADFALRTATMKFGDFPSLRRYSVEAPGPPSQLLVDGFLGNPMLFYGHQAFFSAGIDAFNKTADRVNGIAPDTEWRGLGYIAQHLYLERLRDDGNYDVKTFSGIVWLKNRSPKDATFFVTKQEDFAVPLTVEINNETISFERSGSQLQLQVTIPAGESRQVAIKYRNDLDLAAINISKDSFRITAIRHLSDFRDDVVSKSRVGRGFIRVVVKLESAPNQALLAVLGILVFLGFIGLRRRTIQRAHKAEEEYEVHIRAASK
jgi:peptidoglycan/xylan/chitin deacetylase (PgdA/CDA1 family)